MNYSMAYDYAFMGVLLAIFIACLFGAAVAAIIDSRWMKKRRSDRRFKAFQRLHSNRYRSTK